MKRFILIAVLFALCGALLADDACDCKCAHCGCQAHCHRVCHVVCEMKDVKKVCYCCKEVDVCIPGHSKKCGEECVPDPCCQARPADCEACADNHHNFLDRLFLCHHDGFEHRTLWEPSCSGRAREVTKLMKYEASEKRPTYKWVVEYCCDRCCQEAGPDQMQPASGNAVMNESETGPKVVELHNSASGSLREALRKLNEPMPLKQTDSESQPAGYAAPTAATGTLWNGYSAQ